MAIAIGDYCGLTPSQVYYQFKSKRLPLVQQGSLLIGSKSRLKEYFGAKVELVPEPADATA